MPNELTYNWEVIGHNQQLSLLERAIKGDRLAHAYVFSGPAQVGKKAIARKLAQILLCETNLACGNCINCRTLPQGSNADYLEIKSDGLIKIEEVRDLSYKLSLKPYAGKYKVAVIDNAHNLTTEAANALLKVLEEPKSHTLMILVTDNASRLLSTISSRAQKINFGPLEKNIFASWLLSLGLDQPDPSFAGKPGFVLSLQSDDAAKESQIQNQESYAKFSTASLGEKLALVPSLADQETVDLKKMLDYWLHHLQEHLRRDPSLLLVRKIKGLLRAQRLLDQNVNSKLLLSELMIAT